MTLSDLDKLVRLETFLADEPDSRQEILVGELRGKSREELREMMRKELEMLKQLDEREREIDVWEREGKVPALGNGSQDPAKEQGSPSEEKLP
jgi:hypothetical protein